MPGQIFEFAGVWMSLGVPLRRRWPWITVEPDETVDDSLDSQPTEGSPNGPVQQP